jgi:hypothetical protein
LASQRALALHATPWQGVAYLTGGGSGLIAEWLTTPGASATVLEVSVPYAFAALSERLGGPPEQACSQATARALAMSAYERAEQLQPEHGKAPLFGLAVTASLATNRRKRGAHRAHVAVQTASRSYDARFDFSSTRAREERVLVDAIWQCLTEALRLSVDTPAVDASDRTDTRSPRAWRGLVAGDSLAVPLHSAQADPPPLLLPGSFNPLHRGHKAMMAVAERQLGCTGAYELSVSNVDKPALDYSTLRERTLAFRGRRGAGPLWLTRLPTFIEKARRFPGTTFAVGADTIVRIGAGRYYGGDRAMRAAVREMGELGCRFMVFGRLADGEFRDLSELRLPAALKRLCDPVPEQVFREDLSSTALRAAQAP